MTNQNNENLDSRIEAGIAEVRKISSEMKIAYRHIYTSDIERVLLAMKSVPEKKCTCKQWINGGITDSDSCEIHKNNPELKPGYVPEENEINNSVISLRNWLAGQALSGIVTRAVYRDEGIEDVVSCCYKLADAMIVFDKKEN